MTSIVATLAVIATLSYLLKWRSARSPASRPTAGLVKHEHSRLDRIRGALSTAILCLSFWQLLSDAIHDQLFLPSPSSTALAMRDIIASGLVFRDTAVTTLRILIAVSIAAIIGMPAGIVAALFPVAGLLIMPANSAARYIPPTAFISLAVLYFGIDESGKIALISLAVVWYIVQMTFDVVRQVPPALIESAEMLGVTRFELLSRVVLPYCLPELASVMRVNLGAAWTYVVVAELVTAQSGLGHSLAVSQRMLQTPRVFAIIIIISMVGFLSDTAMAVLIRWLGRWK